MRIENRFSRAKSRPGGVTLAAMKDKLPALIGSALLSLAILLGALAVGKGISGRNRNDAISVTGSAKQRITSDYVIWDASVSSQDSTPGAAATELAAWTTRIRSFLTASGVQASELAVAPVSAVTVQKGSDENGNGKITGYRLTRSFEVRSPRVAAISAVVDKSAKLLEEGIPIEAEPPQFVFTKLPSIRPTLLVKATRDALERARVLVEATGAHLGKPREVDVGVFQVTAPNSTDVSDYGEYDTSTLQKDVTAVVNVTFTLS